MLELQTLVIYGLALAIPAVYIAYRQLYGSSQAPTLTTQDTAPKPQKSIMQSTRDDLAPPKDDPFTLEQLKAYDGSTPGKPIYVAIKGTIFDVSHKADVYGAGRSYNIFAGKDGSKGLGMSSLDPENAVPDYTGLDEKDRKVLDDWHGFFSKRYNIVGKVVDPEAAPASSL
ncbi:putative steroid-binding protein 3 [Hypsizygus marmoreus]|uniref:Steroid-binding protein 3 n=1 Tax=Hypsizygus marmoreus TaxID=39966 RepID=A0A369J6N5_HYPMA|nr:putative steroid-binding protein 3 [Hypsizygus marmoreus]